MPIRINLLAEARAQEQLRRRDPVKRVIGVGICLVLALLAYSSKLQLESLLRKSEVNRLEAQLSSRTNEFRQVTENQQKLADANHRLTSLHRLASSRLLYGNLLNGLQQATIDDVQLMRFRAEQTYTLIEEVKPKTNSDNRILLGRPPAVTERVVALFDAKDSSANPGDMVNKYKQSIADSPYFLSMLGKTNEVRLASLSPPIGGGQGGRPYVLFTLECKFPEKTR